MPTPAATCVTVGVGRASRGSDAVTGTTWPPPSTSATWTSDPVGTAFACADACNDRTRRTQ
jgi:hypothetical protein